jgi:glycosyltransferase involved in cell wall biosynthesis
LIEAAPLILADCPNTKFLFVGSGQAYIQTLQKRVSEMGVVDKICFVGGVSPHDIAPYYAACDIFVFPSIMESLGLSQVEAMLCAKPVVASNVGGISEVMLDGETGFLVEPFDYMSLAQKVIYLLKNPTLANKMGQNGRQRALNLFDKQRILRQYIEVHRQVWQHSIIKEKDDNK